MNALLLVSIISNIHLVHALSEEVFIENKGDGTVQVVMEKGVLANAPGAPALPSIPLFAALPADEEAAAIKVNSVTYRKIEGKYFVPPQQPPAILPFPGYTPKIVTVPPDQSIYTAKGFYPDSPIEMGTTGDFGGVKVIGLILHPVRYNSVDSTIEVLQSIDFEIVTRPDDGKHIVPPRSPLSAALWSNILRKFVLNPQDVNVPTTPGDALDYLIVTPSSFAAPFDTLAIWLNERGLRAEVALIDTAISGFPGRDQAEKLRNFIKHVYETRGITYLLLGGDTPFVPDRVAYAMTSNAGFASDEDSLRADLYYADLDGTWDANNNGTFGEVDDSVDLYPDIFVGRAPVSNISQASTFVHKVMKYAEPIHTNYLARELFFAEILWEDPYTDAGIGKNLIDSLYVPDSVSITKLYESLGNESPSSVMAAINTGANLQNHDGHGFYYVMGVGNGYLYRSDMDRLTNEDRPGVLYSIGCWVGAFDYNAISEHYINNPHGGGVAFIGNSRYGWGSPGNPGYGYSDKLDTEFYGWVFDRGVTEIGVAMALNKATFVPYSRQANVFRWHQYEVNLLGEPSMRIWRGRPLELHIACNDTVFAGQPLRITADHRVDGIVALSSDGRLLLTAEMTDGIAEIRIPETSSSSLLLKVIADGFEAVSKIITVIHAGAHLAVASFSFVDTLSLHPDGLPTPGDSGVVEFVLKNYGTEASSPTTFSAVSVSDSFSLDGHVSLPSLQPGDSVAVSFPFGIGLVPYQRLSMEITIGEVARTMAFSVATPLLKVVDYETDSFLTPGANEVGLKLANIGTAPAHEGYLLLEPLSSELTFSPDSLAFQELGVGDTVMLTTEATVSGSALGRPLRIELSPGCDGYLSEYDTLIMVVGEQDYASGFEDQQGIAGWTAEQPWHISSHRAHSGDSAWYCGNESTHRYPNNASTSLVSPTFVAGTEPTLSFYLWFSVTTYGSDGLYVLMEKDGQDNVIDYIGSGGALDSLLGFWTDWARYTYALDFLEPGDTFRVKFQFVSDFSDFDEGFYIDDVELYDVVPLGTQRVGEGADDRLQSGVRLLTLSEGLNIRMSGRPFSTIKFQLYDPAGRLIRDGSLRLDAQGQGTVRLSGLAPGVYIVRTPIGNSKGVVLK